LAAVRELSRAIGVGGMVGGQYIDVAGRDLDADGLRRMHELKTGRLIAASVVVAPLLLGAADAATAALRAFARELGVLFQIVDDILDVTGSEAKTGKPQGSDERLGKRTYVSAFGLDRARELAQASRDATLAALERARGLLTGETSALEQVAEFVYARES